VKPDPTKLLGRPPMIPAVCAGPGIPGLVSVLIPTYNRAYIICSAIDSVLAQTYKKIEVVVVDDGSTDNTRELLARYGDAVRYIYQPNAGLAAARNTGLAAARGEFIALQDSDDLWLPWKIEGQMAVMALDQRIGLCWTDLTAVNPKGEVVRERNLRPAYDVYSRIRFADHFDTSGMLHDAWQGCPEALRDTRYHFGDVYSAMFLGNLVHPPTALMRRTHVAKAGGLDGTYARTCEDYEFFWRVSAHGLGALVDAPGMLYRVEAGDQLTHPGMMVYLARGNLQAVRDRLKHGRKEIRLPDEAKRDHLVGAYQWLASEELQGKNGRWSSAVACLARALVLKPSANSAFRLLTATLLPGRLWKLASDLRQRLKRHTLARA
jgi:GT2 family glycosyltransferase